jgi:hypothetical protein
LVFKEARHDIPPFVRAEVWACLLEIDINYKKIYVGIDKETAIATDRQVTNLNFIFYRSYIKKLIKFIFLVVNCHVNLLIKYIILPTLKLTKNKTKLTTLIWVSCNDNL